MNSGILDVSCIIINYNTSGYTLKCIESILAKTSNELSFEIIVVDNASKPDDFYHLETSLNQLSEPNVRLVRSKINTGFGGGNSLGFQFCGNSRYVVFINNDVEFMEDDCLSVLKKFMDETPDAGLVSPQSVNEHLDFVPTFDHFASVQREIFKRKTLEVICPKTYLKRKKEYFKPLKVQFIAGSFMFFRKEDFEKIGGFDTNIFLYYEETDLSRNLKYKLGKNTYLFPTIKYKHYHGASTTKSMDIKIEQKISLLYIINKHYGWFAHKILLIFFIIRYFFTSLIKPKYWKLWYYFVLGMPLSKSLKQKQEYLNRS